MARQSLERRVDGLEQRVDLLEALPARMDNLEHIVQLRSEMQSEFSAVRSEMREQGQHLRTEICEGDEATRT